ncbi:MAG: response regulator [Rhodospirillales bacterium]|nr:response regulator [Rhodospirillales bacterium]MCB9965041.1 response regulator [Rhodospirillales bacterium]MCB9980369.1 response regulator [Rhodospirillales bacterium]
MPELSHTYRILIAEDNDFVRMQIVKFLSDAGYQVDDFDSALNAVSVIGDSYDLAIVDVRMEPMGGFDFIKAMKGEGISTPVILVTGDQDPDLLSDASRLGVGAVLIKPVQKDRLLKTVEKTLQKKKGG